MFLLTVGVLKTNFITTMKIEKDTITDISAWLGLHPGSLYNILGRKRGMSVSTLVRLVEISGISADDWIFLPGDSLKCKIIDAYKSR